MISVSDELAGLIRAGGFVRECVCDVIVDGERVIEDHPLTRCELRSDAGARIRTQGSALFTYTDELGASIVPTDLTSWLTPYATYLSVSMRISAGDFTEKVLQGYLKVVGVKDPTDTRALVGDRLISVGSAVRLVLADQFAVTDRERFPVPSSPSQLTSVWAELGVVTGFPLVQNITDTAITRDVTYQENRLDAVFDLAAILEGTPYMTPDGYLTVLPDEWGSEQEALLVGADGTVTRTDPADWTDEGVYNQVVVRSYDSDQATILATREVTSGPLRYGGPFGRVPYFASSQYVTTSGQAADYAEALLPQVSGLPAATYTVQCVPDPRREIGDVVPFTYQGETLVGRIVRRTLAESGPMTLALQVDRG